MSIEKEGRSDSGANINEIAAYYSEKLKRFGASVEAVDWGSREAQQTRFAVLSDVGITQEDSVLDIGSGLGDFYDYLRRMGRLGEYCGADITREMVDAAKKRFAEAQFVWIEKLNSAALESLGGNWDYVVASGIFYLRRHDGMSYLEEAVRSLFAVCRKGVAFNSLSSWSEPRDMDNEFRPDPLAVVQLCRQLTPHIVMRHDYHRGDFTIFLRREKFR